MPVIGTAGELSESMKAEFSREKTEFWRYYLVLCSSVFDDGIIAINAPGIPRYLQPYSTPNAFNDFARVRKITPNREGAGTVQGGQVWKVEVYYSTPTLRGENGMSSGKETEAEANNPMLELPTIEKDSETFQVIAYDENPGALVIGEGNGQKRPLKNSAGEIFDPPPMKDDGYPIYRFTRNEDLTSPIPALSLLFENSVNADVFFGFAPGVVKCQKIPFAKAYKNTPANGVVPYLKVKYEFKCKWDGWDLKLLDAGHYFLFQPTMAQPAVKKFFKSVDGHPIVDKLDGFGHPLPVGDPPHYLAAKQIYRRTNFGVLNLPQSFLECR